MEPPPNPGHFTLGRDPSARAAARQPAARLDDGSELGHVLRKVLEDVADGQAVVILRPSQEFTPAVAAKVLGVTRQFVDRLCVEEVIPFRRLPASRHRKILLSDVLAVAAERDRRREGAAAIRAALDDPSRPSADEVVSTSTPTSCFHSR